MLKRCATLMVGMALVGLGVLFFFAPERTHVVQLLVQFWPLFLILAGIVRVAGHVIDRHPRSPVGGLMLVAMGGIMLAANLRGEYTFLSIFGRYWFWLLLALITGRVIRQYTYRPQDGPCPRTFGFGTILLMVLIIGGGLAANRLSTTHQLLSWLRLPVGQLGEVRDESALSALVSEVSDANFEDEVLHSRQPVLVDFGAPWCAPCRLLAPSVEAVAKKYQGRAKVVRLNVDENVDRSSRYRIRGLPTLILFRDGQEAERVVGVPANAQDFISAMLDKHLSSGLARAGREDEPGN